MSVPQSVCRTASSARANTSSKRKRVDRAVVTLRQEPSTRLRFELVWVVICSLVFFFALALPVTSHAQTAPQPPAYFRQLIDTGGVKFEFYDRRPEGQRWPGRANFWLNVPYQTTYRYRTEPVGNKKLLTIDVTLESVKFELSHKLVLPRSLNHARSWRQRLMKHEFDHVAISSDPRMFMLVEHLHRNVKQIKATVAESETPDKKFLLSRIEKEFAARRDAVNQLIRANYVLLDKVSRHGVAPIPNRRLFFESLYTKSNLDAAGFAYTGEVLGLLKSKAYREAKLLYDVGNGATRTKSPK